MKKLFKLHFTSKQQLLAGLILATILQLISFMIGAITLPMLPIWIVSHVAFSHTWLSLTYALGNVNERVVFFPNKKKRSI